MVGVWLANSGITVVGYFFVSLWLGGYPFWVKYIRAAIVCFALFCIFGFGLVLGILLFRKGSAAIGPVQIQNTATVLRQVQTMSELVTVKYVLEKVVVLEDPKWYGENRVLMVAHGVVKGGINLKDLKPEDLETSGHKVIMRLPTAFVTEAFLDERRTQVLEHSTGVLRTFDKELQQNARQQAIASILKAAREMGIQKDAEERAKIQLKELFFQLGFREVEFK